jgi:hypothetical protein
VLVLLAASTEKKILTFGIKLYTWEALAIKIKLGGKT